MTSFLSRMPAGFPGRISRSDSKTVTPEVVDASAVPSGYGLPVKLVSGQVAALASADAVSVVYGFLVSPYPTESTSNTLNQAASPPSSGIVDVLKRGYIIVPLASGTAAKGGAVYVCLATANGTVGTIAAASGTGFSAIPNAMFQGPADSNGNVEISFNVDLPQ